MFSMLYTEINWKCCCAHCKQLLKTTAAAATAAAIECVLQQHTNRYIVKFFVRFYTSFEYNVTTTTTHDFA